MSKKHFVFSTLTTDQKYVKYLPSGNDIPVEGPSVYIHGGANVASKRLITPRGAVTEVDDDELALLNDCDLFKLHVANGFITVSTSKPDEDAAAADQTSRDQSSPLVPEDYPDKGTEVAHPSNQGSDTPGTGKPDKPGRKA